MSVLSIPIPSMLRRIAIAMLGFCAWLPMVNSQAATVLIQDFSQGLGSFSSSGRTSLNSMGIILRGGDSGSAIESGPISIAGFQNLSLILNRRANRLDSGEAGLVEVSVDGGQYVELESEQNASGSVTLPINDNNGSVLSVRIRLKANSYFETFTVRSLTLSGDGSEEGGEDTMPDDPVIDDPVIEEPPITGPSSNDLNSPPATSLKQFRNPLFGNGADPWLQYYNGNYYLVTTTWTSQLVMRKSPTLAGLATATPVNIWSDTTPSRCCNFWAFEFHRLKGPNGDRWYVIYSAGVDGTLDGQRTHILESESDDPMGPYQFKSTLMPNRWNIDGTYLEQNNRLYFLWSEWDGPDQVTWISAMSNPWTLTGTKTIIARPTMSWERVGANVNEGPEIIQRNGRTFMTYSASSCDTPDYKLGLMELVGSNPVSASAWSKDRNPVFQQGNGVYGVGHNGFFKSPDGSEDWLVYHGNSSSRQGCGDTRAVRAQKISWGGDGRPQFGTPASSSRSLASPSGENGPLTTKVEGASMLMASRADGRCITNNNRNAVQGSCSGSASQWTLDSVDGGYFRLANKENGLFLGVSSCSRDEGANVAQHPWLNSACQQWRLESADDGWFTLSNRETGKHLEVGQCNGMSERNVYQGADSGSECQQWRLQPAKTVAIMSAQSGKAVEVGSCSTSQNANVHQWQWLDTDCQKWRFTHTDNGYLELHPSHNSGQCLGVSSGANVSQQVCGNGAGSQWRLQPLTDGAIGLVSRQSGMNLDVANCDIANGANLGQYNWLDNICQRFHLRDVD